MEDVRAFLTETGLGKYADAFREAEISGEVLLEADEEMLRELGVESALDRLRIPLLFKRRLHRTRVKSVEMVVVHSYITLLAFHISSVGTQCQRWWSFCSSTAWPSMRSLSVATGWMGRC